MWRRRPVFTFRRVFRVYFHFLLSGEGSDLLSALFLRGNSCVCSTARVIALISPPLAAAVEICPYGVTYLFFSFLLFLRKIKHKGETPSSLFPMSHVFERKPLFSSTVGGTAATKTLAHTALPQQRARRRERKFEYSPPPSSSSFEVGHKHFCSGKFLLASTRRRRSLFLFFSSSPRAHICSQRRDMML